jgi:hypothetical protein
MSLSHQKKMRTLLRGFYEEFLWNDVQTNWYDFSGFDGTAPNYFIALHACTIDAPCPQ